MRLEGIVPIIPTPFDLEGGIDFAQLRGLIDFATAAGAAAACLPAYASEFYKLSEEERIAVVATAVEQSAGRLPVLGQVNYYGSRQAAAVAARLEGCGVAGVSTAVPRLFALAEDDLFDHFSAILDKISVPLVIQDFNPGGPSVSAAFIARLHRAYPHFRYVKLEEPRMADKVKAIHDATGGGVGVIEGLGGMYILELLDAGVTAVMPGLALTDLLARIYVLAREGRKVEAYRIFETVLPQIVYSLQNMELFHYAEKRLLVARGVLDNSRVRSVGLKPGAGEQAHIDFLNQRIVETLETLGLPLNPARSTRQA